MRGAVRRHLGAAFDVLYIPSEQKGISGQAFVDDAGRCYIHLEGRGSSVLALFVLLHEIAHHHLGHVRAWHSHPAWAIEYEADLWAFNAIRDLRGFFAGEEEELVAARKAHLRAHMQPYLDHDLWHNVDFELARWAGCRIEVFPLEPLTPYLRGVPAAGGCCWDDEDLPF